MSKKLKPATKQYFNKSPTREKKNAFSTLDFGNAFAKLQNPKKNCGFCKCIFMDFANAFS